MQNVVVTSQPLTEPVSVSECKAFMRIDTDDDDFLIADFIGAARELCEQHLRRKLINTTLQMTLDTFPIRQNDVWWNGTRDGAVSQLLFTGGRIYLPFPPVTSVTSVTVYNDANVTTVVDSAVYRLNSAGYIELNDNQQWPLELREYAAVEIVYVAGYGAAPASVPAAIRHAIKVTVAAMYEDRTCFSMPPAATAALAPYRVLEERHNGM